MRRKEKFDSHEDEQLRRYMALSPKKKLEYLEQMNQFLSAAMPAENKKIWQQLKTEGW